MFHPYYYQNQNPVYTIMAYPKNNPNKRQPEIFKTIPIHVTQRKKPKNMFACKQTVQKQTESPIGPNAI